MSGSRPASAAWLDLSWEAWRIGVDMSVVIPLRLARIAAGGAHGQREAMLMVEEKIAANAALAQALMTGALGATAETIAKGTLGHYGRRVKANRTRLSLPPPKS